VSPRGDDAAVGLSPATAWWSLAHAGAESLRPGDHLLLKGGAYFAGTLEFGPQDAGDATDPVVIAAYGSGAPVIDAGDAPAIVIAGTQASRSTTSPPSATRRPTSTGPASC
jgi:hypothetical protein